MYHLLWVIVGVATNTMASVKNAIIRRLLVFPGSADTQRALKNYNNTNLEFQYLSVRQINSLFR